MKGDFTKGAAPNPETLPIRELLAKFGYSRRGDWIVSRIRNQLEELNLRTVPDFEVGWIDSSISIELDSEVTGASPLGKQPDPTYRIGMLDAAHNEPIGVTPNDSLNVATTKMQLHDFSQLPVMETAHSVKGVISWKSIGTRHSLRCECQFVHQCMDPQQEVSINTPLFEVIGTIQTHSYVLVRGDNNAISGIVTASDLSHQFMQLASPFLFIGEIEGHLRNLIHRKFTVEEMTEASLGQEEGNTIAGTADLTFGEYCRLLQKPERWERIGLNIDRHEFTAHLDSIRELRNDIMHFNPDGLSEKDIKKLQDVARFFEDLVRYGVM